MEVENRKCLRCGQRPGIMVEGDARFICAICRAEVDTDPEPNVGVRRAETFKEG